MSHTIVDPAAFCAELCLHDALLELLEWSPGSMKLTVEDLYSNFSGLPGYPRPLRGSIEFRGVRHVVMETDAEERLTIYELEVREDAASDLFSVEIRLAPGGMIRLTCQTIEGDFDWHSIKAALPSD